MITNDFIDKFVKHFAGSDVSVKVLWDEHPPTESAAGEVVKSVDGDLTIYIANLGGRETRLKVLLHELSHCLLDYDYMPETITTTSKAGVVTSSQMPLTDEQKIAWEGDYREKRASKFVNLLWDYGEKNLWKYRRVGREVLECRMLAIMDWNGV